MAEFKRFEIETCECGCVTPLGYIHYNEDGIGTCINCVNDELISRLDKKNKQIKNLKAKLKSALANPPLNESVLPISDVSVSLPSDDEIKLTDNGFGAMEAAINKMKGNEH